MTYLVGYGPHRNDRGAIELACQLARSIPAPVVAVSVVPRGWGTPVAGDTDREYEQWMAQEGDTSSAAALEEFTRHPDVDGSAVWVSGRSVPQTLVEQAETRDASMIVVGSSVEAEPGRIQLTSKTDRLVHSSTVPVAIAPRSYVAEGPVTRITVGFRDDDASWSLLHRVAELARDGSVGVRLVTFLVSPSRSVTNTVSHAETQVIEIWSLQARTAQAAAEAQLNAMGFTGDRLELCLAEGGDWTTAVSSIEWTSGDVLVVGSSSTHRLAQVFLGSSAAKIVRHAPVPVVVVPGAGE